MFEDSTFASTGRIRMRSRAGTIAAVIIESAALAALLLFPLIYPGVLSQRVRTVLIEPPLPIERQPQQPPAQMARMIQPAFNVISLSAPRVIPQSIDSTQGPEPPAWNPGDMIASGGPGIGTGPFAAAPAVRMAHPALRGPLPLSSSIVSGMLVEKSLPDYPVIALTTHTQGTVVLAAVISRAGSIEELRVVSGPAMLRQAALDAVRTWRYRPYLLDGAPIEVETTISVIFTLDQ